MAVINYSKKEISAKIVYYGPSVCGKTTNIQSIYGSIKPDQKGKLVSLATEADRTLFFDFLPIEIANIRGFKTRLHFYTVPGQVYYNSTRRAVLTGVDGLVFVADSQRDKMEENVESLANLEENLNYYGKSMKTLPLVMQYNKRDLPDVTPVSEMEQILNPDGYPYFEAVATTGEGVLQTLTKVTKMVLKHIEMGTSGKPQQPQRPEPVPERHAPETPLQQNLEQTVSHADLMSHRTEANVQDRPMTRQAEPVEALSGGFGGGRIQIVGTDNAKIISVNAISIPLHLKIEGDPRTFTMDLAVKLDRIVPEE
jgi:mutual gliding-motility protein MglA